MTFEDALYNLKLGNKLVRSGWNSIGVHVFMAPEAGVQVPHKLGGGFPVPPTFWMKTVDDHLVPWFPSPVDMIVDDWMLVSQPLREDQLIKNS